MTRPQTAVAAAPAQQAVAVSRPKLIAAMAAKYQVDPDKMMKTLSETAFRGDGKNPVTNEQMMALLVIANEYNLNPWLKEIYAFPHQGGIVPVIGVDGWTRLMNTHPAFLSQSFKYPDVDDDEIPAWIECSITRRDRDLPTTVREYYSECKRGTAPWGSHPRRMLRHKALIQCVRLAFGFGGVYDPDEAERVREAIDVTPTRPHGKPETEAPRAIEAAQVAMASVDQLTLIRDALKEADVAEGEVFEQFKVESLEQITFDDVAAVLAWIQGE